MLKDQKYESEIKDLIKFTKLNYVQLDEYMNETNINAIPDHQLRFSISDQLFFDIFLIEIRGKTIAYALYKKKMELNRENVLLEEISKLEKETIINFELLDQKK